MAEDLRPVYSVRPATAGDLQTVRHLYGQISSDVSNIDADLPDVLNSPSAFCVIVETGGRPVGMAFCCVRNSLSAGRKMVIDDIVVDREARGTGLGRWLLAYVIDEARMRMYSVWLRE